MYNVTYIPSFEVSWHFFFVISLFGCVGLSQMKGQYVECTPDGVSYVTGSEKRGLCRENWFCVMTKISPKF